MLPHLLKVRLTLLQNKNKLLLPEESEHAFYFLESLHAWSGNTMAIPEGQELYYHPEKL